MGHFARVKDGIVQEVIVAEQPDIDSGRHGVASEWIQTSYNTIEGVHRLSGTPLRWTYAGPGYIYNSELDIFYPPCPYPSWTFNAETKRFDPPVTKPEEDMTDPTRYYVWDEDTLSWKLIVRDN